MAVAPENLPEYFGQWNVNIDKTQDANYDAAGSYNIGPTRYAPIFFVARENPDEEENSDLVDIVQYANWGFVPNWTKKAEDAQPWRRFNARKETLAGNSSMWKASANRKRCVVPVQGYYEWFHKPVKNTKKVDKIPYYIKRKDNKLMFLAGMRDTCKYEDSDELHHTFTIVTGPAPKQLRWLHERMPVVMTPGTKEFAKWLDPNEREFNQDLLNCLDEYDKEDLEWYEVSTDVNKYSGTGPELIKPIKNTQKGIMSFLKDPRKEKDGNSKVKEEHNEAKVKPEQASIKDEYLAKVEDEEKVHLRSTDTIGGKQKEDQDSKVTRERGQEKEPKKEPRNEKTLEHEESNKSNTPSPTKRKPIDELISSRVKREKT